MITIHTDPAPQQPPRAASGLWFYNRPGTDILYMAKPGAPPIAIDRLVYWLSGDYTSWEAVKEAVRRGELVPLDEGQTINLILTRRPR